MKSLKILFIGDIFGKAGRSAVSMVLPRWKREYIPHLVIANIENIRHGHGISKIYAREMMQCGVDVMTGGNHSFESDVSLDALTDDSLPVIRPANAPRTLPGKGYFVCVIKKQPIAIINLMGQFGMRQHFNSPYETIEDILKIREVKKSLIIIDWHAEATSEKTALGWLLDGRVSAVIGTHTHIATRDERILPKGTAFITDVGMTGPYNSVIGNKIGPALERFTSQKMMKVDIEESPPYIINAVLIEIDKKTKKALSIKHLHEVIE